MYRFDCRVSAFSAMTSGPDVRGETGSRWRPSSCWYRMTPRLLTRPSRAEITSTPARPVPRDERPLGPRGVNVSHADEPAAFQRCLPATGITKPELADEGHVPDVEFMPVAEQRDIGEPDRVLALDPQHEDQPVRQVDEVLVEHGLAAQDRCLTVVAAVRVGTRIVHAVGVLPLRRAARTQVAVARRGERFAQPLSPGIEPVIAEQETVHGTSCRRGRLCGHGRRAGRAEGVPTPLVLFASF